ADAMVAPRRTGEAVNGRDAGRGCPPTSNLLQSKFFAKRFVLPILPRPPWSWPDSRRWDGPRVPLPGLCRGGGTGREHPWNPPRNLRTYVRYSCAWRTIG